MKSVATINVTALIAASTLAFPAACLAQVEDRPRFEPYINIGYSWTRGVTADYLERGTLVGGGVTWNTPTMPVSLRLDLSYTRFRSTENLLAMGTAATQIQIDGGRGHIAAVDLNAVREFPISERLHGYITAGIGGYFRRIELTQRGRFTGLLCDDWWGVCFYGDFPADRLIAKDSTWRLGWNGGLGLEYALLSGSRVFLEVSYHRMQTDISTEFIPIRIGYRF